MTERKGKDEVPIIDDSHLFALDAEFEEAWRELEKGGEGANRFWPCGKA